MTGQAACHSLTIYFCIKTTVFLLFYYFWFPPNQKKNQVYFNALKCKSFSGWWWNKDIWIKLKTDQKSPSTSASSQPGTIQGRERTEERRNFLERQQAQTRPSRNGASGVAATTTCIWKMEKAKRLSHQKGLPAWNPELLSQQWIRKVSSGQIPFVDIGFDVSLWRRSRLGRRPSR